MGLSLSLLNGMWPKELPNSGFSTSNLNSILLSQSPLSPEMTNAFAFHVMTAQNTADNVSGLSEAKSLVSDY